MLSEALVLIFILLITLFLAANVKRRPKNYPPGPRWSLPVIGHMAMLGSKPYETLLNWKAKYGPVIAVQMGSFPAVFINDSKLIREALNSNALSGRPAIKFFQDRSGGKARGLLFTDGNTWMELRRFVLRNLRDFGFGKSSMESIISEEASDLVERLKLQENKKISLQNTFNAAILNALWCILTGERFSQTDPELIHAIKLLTSSIQENRTSEGVAMFVPWLAELFPNLSGYKKLLKNVPEVAAFIFKPIPKHEATFEEGVQRDFLDVFISEMRKTTDPSSPFHRSDKQIEWVLADLFVAGTETTSTVLSWTFLLLSNNPDVQWKLHEEIDKIIGKSRQPSLADRDNMPYTQAVMNEALRYSSLVPMSIFHRATEDTQIGGYFIPKDTMILPNLYAAHYDKTIWRDPENFRPERFLNKSGAFVRNENFMAFSVGKRVCLGESLARDEYFLFLTHLFQTFHVRIEGKIDMEPNVGMVVTPKPHNYILKQRNV